MASSQSTQPSPSRSRRENNRRTSANREEAEEEGESTIGREEEGAGWEEKTGHRPLVGLKGEAEGVRAKSGDAEEKER